MPLTLLIGAPPPVPVHPRVQALRNLPLPLIRRVLVDHRGPLGRLPGALILTYSLDRLLIDPLPGLRHTEDFTDLHPAAPDVLVFRDTTHPLPPMGSSLPQLSGAICPELALLEPQTGASGITTQINAAHRYTEADRIDVIDVGGDAAAARGNDYVTWRRIAEALNLRPQALGNLTATSPTPARGRPFPDLAHRSPTVLTGRPATHLRSASGQSKSRNGH